MKKTIVLQDADQDVLDILTYTLKIEGYKVISTKECNESLFDLVNTHKPKLVVLDYKISGELCIQALKGIRIKHPHLPVIAISCNNDIDEVYNKYGFVDYIRKPFDLDGVCKTIEMHISK